MGRSYTPKYRIEFLQTNGSAMTNQGWDCKRYGKPSEKNLEKFLDAYSNSTKIGGVNERISKSLGFIPVVSKARIVNQFTNDTVVEYNAPMFKVL